MSEELRRLIERSIAPFEQMLQSTLAAVSAAEDKEGVIAQAAKAATDKLLHGVRVISPDMVLAICTGIAAAIMYRALASKLITNESAVGERIMARIFERVDAPQVPQQTTELALGTHVENHGGPAH